MATDEGARTSPRGEVRSRRDGAVLHLELANPARRNALTLAMYDELQKRCVEARADASLRAVVVRGAGEAFAAGTDIGQFKEIERRLAAADRAVDADDVLADCYGSADFQEGVAAFLARRAPRWSGS
jgi:enoyl-CoA hydratase/carnithine racemase